MIEIKLNVHLTADSELLAAVMAVVKAAAVSNAVVSPQRKAIIEHAPAIEATKPETVQDPPEGEPEPSTNLYTLPELFKATEQELMELPASLLLEGIKWAGIDISKFPGKNTNAKLRKIILDHDPYAGEDVKDPEEADVEEAQENEIPDEAVPDRVEFRSYMVPRIQSKDPAVKKAAIDVIKNSGFASVDEMYAKGTPADILRVKNEILKIKV